MLLETTESLDPASSLAGPPLLHVPPNIPARACSIANSVYLACSALPGKILPLMSPLYAFPCLHSPPSNSAKRTDFFPPWCSHSISYETSVIPSISYITASLPSCFLYSL